MALPTKKPRQPQSEPARKKAEEVLRQIQLIVQHSHDAIIGETLDGIVTAWNGGAEETFGYPAAEVLGKPIKFLVPPDRQDELTTQLAKVRAGGVIADLDTVRLKKDGTRIDVAITVSPVKTEDGTVIGASVVERDISMRRKALKRIEELNETRNKFINIISHQLRTPLTVVNWNLEEILNGNFGKLEESTRSFLLATHKSSVEVTDRIHALLTALDIEEGRVTLVKEETAIDSITTAVMVDMKKRSELKGIAFHFTAPEHDLPSIEADGEKIRTAVVNLMSNAITYTKEKGEVSAELSLKGEAIRFSVRDTGIGIPAPEQHRVFTRFFRASNASVMMPDAFGLGLFVAKSFIEQHGGKIGFTSVDGKGSTFWFELPLKAAAA